MTWSSQHSATSHLHIRLALCIACGISCLMPQACHRPATPDSSPSESKENYNFDVQVDEVWTSLLSATQLMHRAVGFAKYRGKYFYWEGGDPFDSSFHYLVRGSYLEYDDRIELRHPFGDPLTLTKETRSGIPCLVMSTMAFDDAMSDGWVLVRRPRATAKDPFCVTETALDVYYGNSAPSKSGNK